jgi:hypothetical protein
MVHSRVWYTYNENSPGKATIHDALNSNTITSREGPLGDHTLPAPPWTREARQLRRDSMTLGTKGMRGSTLSRTRCSGPTSDGSKPSTHSFHAFLDPHAVRRDSTVRATTRADVRPTIIRVQGFEMTKQKHNNATKKVTILLGEEKFRTYRQNQGSRDRRRRTTT